LKKATSKKVGLEDKYRRANMSCQKVGAISDWKKNSYVIDWEK
jgi:hypothetical protein